MKLYRWLGYAAVITAVIAAVILLATHASNNRPKAAVTTISHQPSSKPKAKPKPITKPQPVKTVPHRPKPTTEPLPIARIKGLLQEYYLNRPGDTAETRRQRIAPFVSARLLDRLSFGVNRSRTSTSVDQVPTDEMEVKPLNGNSRTRRVSAAVLLSVKRGAGSDVKYIKLSATSTWHYSHGEWIAVSFN